LAGSLTFLSTTEITDLEKRLSTGKEDETAIIDLSSVTNLDSSGAAAIVGLFKLCHDRHIACYMKGLSRRFEPLFHTQEGRNIIDNYYIVSESEMRDKEVISKPISSYGRLIHGVQRFYADRKHNDQRLFEFLAHKQDPHTLFITCSDSRIVPTEMTSSAPGDLFTVRNVGNYIPGYEKNMPHGEAAALEFALTQLNITDIVVCGHANCGAIRACVSKKDSTETELQQWISMIRSQLDLSQSKDDNAFAMDNVLNQITNLKKYPIVQSKLAADELTLHAWFFDFEQSKMYEWNEEAQQFLPILAEDTN
jgi:carbonic anhydrase